MTHFKSALLAGGACVALAGFLTLAPARADDTRTLPAPIADMSTDARAPQTAVFAGGCFWGIQGVFQHVKGVQSAVSGYAGGKRDSADYETVSTGTTGHAESVKVVFDPKVISYGQLLRVFFSVALDPTQKDAQGPDSGTQYRSELFYTDAAQKKVAEAYIAQLNSAHLFSAPIATRVDPMTGFYPAEDYHQNFLAQNPNHPYIVVNDLPKVAALKARFPELYSSTPTLVHTGS